MFTQMRSNLKFLGTILFALVFLMGGVLTVKSAQAYEQADFKAFDGVNIGTNSYTVSSGITATYNNGTGTENDPVNLTLTGYAPIVTPWFNHAWTGYNYVAIGIKLPTTGFIGTPVTGGTAVYQADVMRYDNPTGYTVGYGTIPLATQGAALGYLDYEFAASSNNTKENGLVKLKVLWNANSAPEYFTIDINNLHLGPNAISPTATVTHDESAKTITYTFNEPVQLRDAGGNVLDNSTYASSLAVYDSVVYLAHTPGAAEPGHAVTVSSATLSSDAKSIIITYTGSLIKSADTSYVVDAWGKNITDLAGNKMAQNASQIFPVPGDTTAPSVISPVAHTETSTGGTITYNFDEAVQLRDSNGAIIPSTSYAASLGIYKLSEYGAHVLYTPAPATYGTITNAVLSNDAKSLTITYTGSLIETSNVTYIVDAWGSNITDALGNKMLQNAGTQSFTVTGDITAPVITLTGANPQTIELGAGYTELYATTDDGSAVVINATAFVNAVGSYTITYNSTDAAGNVAITVTRTVNVVKATPSSHGRSSGSSATPAVPAKTTTPDGCEAGNKFSTTTGRNCNAATPAVPAGQVLGASTQAGQVLGASSFHFTILVKNGSNGSEIIELQKFLNTLGYTLVADGKFGPKTKGAVIKFQITNGLKGDGVVGPLTRTILNK